MRAALAAGMRCVAVPNRLTSRIARPEVDLVVGSLAERPLAALVAELDAAGEPVAARARG
jgi:beta-phosphoglucomutase-like phosphatase (HAD superfamily)